LIDSTLKALGHALRERRRGQSLTLEELAARAGTSSRHLGEIERGMVDARWRTIVRLADALGLRVTFVKRSEGDGRG
jgi:transcriptional regulator with XRE-family HTH domain